MVSRKTSSSSGTECSSVGYKIPKMDSATGPEPNTTNKPVLDSHSALLLDGSFSDVTFLLGDRKEQIRAHQLFLKARSPVFRVMLSERWNQDKVLLEHEDPATFRKFLRFIYTDALDAAVAEALELLQLGHKYDVQFLVTKCYELLESQVTLDDALPVFQAARLYQNKRLMDRVGNLWAESLSEFQTLPSFSQLDKETLMYILQREDLDMKEVDLFRLALQWGGNQTGATLQESLQDILPLIRFPTMTLNEFTDTVVPAELLSPSTVTQIFIYFGTEDMAKRRSLAKTLGFSTQQRQPKRNVVYVALYPEDNGSARHEQFVNLTESLQFHESQDSETKTKDVNLGICGFTCHCPTKTTIAAASGTASDSSSLKTFKICLQSKEYEDDDDPRGNFYFCNRFYTELVSFPSVQVEEGTTTEVKFETVIPLKKRRLYSITVEEVVDMKRIDPEGYNAQVFGPDSNELVTVMVNGLVRTRLAVQRNRLQGFWGDNKGYACPQLISRLAFQVL